MKKILLFAAVATLFAACTKDATNDLAPAKPTDTFYASIGEDDSRVQLNEQMQTVWTEGDRVSVFNKTTGNRRYKFTGKTGDRTGELSYMNGGTTGSTISQVVAVYPYNSANAISVYGSKITTTIPARQTYCKDSYSIGSSIMVAWSKTEKLSFHNVMGWIRIALTGYETIKTITLQGNNNELVAGGATIKSDMSVEIATGGTKMITLDCGDGVALSKEKPTYFYIALLPQTFENGLSVIATDADGGCMYLKCDDKISVKRNSIIPTTLKLYEKDDENIIAPYQIWYTTSDNKIITPSGYHGNILSNVYQNGKGVITFDYIQTVIDNSAFKGCTELTSITIPDSVISIGDDAFHDCTGLTSVTIPNGVTTIGSSAFNGCTGLTSITIPDSVTSIGNNAFAYCTGELFINCNIPSYRVESSVFYKAKFTKVTIGNSVTTIGDSAFSGCTGMTSITIPDSVTTIGYEAFMGCTSLKGVYISDIAAWCDIEFNYLDYCSCNPLCYAHNLYLNGELVTDLVIPDGVTLIGDYAFKGCTSLTSVTIGNSVTEIGDLAFCNCTSLKGVYISDIAAWCNIKFDDYTYGCNPLAYAHNLYLNGELVTDLVIPDGITEIGVSAFKGCTSLTSVTIGNSVTSIDRKAFYGCSSLKGVHITDIAAWCNIKFGDYGNPLHLAHNLYLNGELVKDLVIPDGITTIGTYAFYGCTSLTSVIIPDSVTSIGYKTFYGCTGLTSITIPDSVTEIGSYTFENCTGLTSVTIPDSVTSIGNGVFGDCYGLASVTIPDSVTSIGDSAFSDCIGLTSVTIPGSVTTIGDDAFWDCYGLTSVTIPDSVTSIGDDAFNYCKKLEKVYCKAATPPSLGTEAFDNVATNVEIYVPCSSVNKYKSATNWKDYDSRIEGYDF